MWPEGRENHRWPPRQTDAAGAFLVRDLPPGPYVVRVRAGEAGVERTEVVRIGTRTEVEFAPLDDHAGG